MKWSIVERLNIAPACLPCFAMQGTPFKLKQEVISGRSLMRMPKQDRKYHPEGEAHDYIRDLTRAIG